MYIKETLRDIYTYIHMPAIDHSVVLIYGLLWFVIHQFRLPDNVIFHNNLHPLVTLVLLLHYLIMLFLESQS
jgi:hypothetical protein